MTSWPLFIPICLVVFLVVEAIRFDDPKIVVKRAAVNFAILTTVLVAVSSVLFFINKYL